MGRGVSAGGGQSSLGYLFGNGETPNNAPAPKSAPAPKNAPVPTNEGQVSNGVSEKPATCSSPMDKSIAAGVHGDLRNNYYRSEGQNCGNFITDRPSTKVHAAPGGGSSLGYLFGDNGKNARLLEGWPVVMHTMQSKAAEFSN